MSLLQGSTNYSPETKRSPRLLTPDLEDSTCNRNGGKAITSERRAVGTTAQRSSERNATHHIWQVSEMASAKIILTFNSLIIWRSLCQADKFYPKGTSLVISSEPWIPVEAWWQPGPEFPRLLPKHLKEQKERLQISTTYSLSKTSSLGKPIHTKQQAAGRLRNSTGTSTNTVKNQESNERTKSTARRFSGKEATTDKSNRRLTDGRDMRGGGKQQNTPEGVRWRLQHMRRQTMFLNRNGQYHTNTNSPETTFLKFKTTAIKNPLQN